MSFWENQQAKAERLKQEAHAAWLDVEPETCTVCTEHKRGVLLGICTPCFAQWQEENP
jgi:hypothetical protein